MRKKVKLLSDHDVQEVVKFQQYLRDKDEMPKLEFLDKYRDYMGLTDAEYDSFRRLAQMTRGSMEPDSQPPCTKKHNEYGHCVSEPGESADPDTVELIRLNDEVRTLRAQLQEKDQDFGRVFALQAREYEKTLAEREREIEQWKFEAVPAVRQALEECQAKLAESEKRIQRLRETLEQIATSAQHGKITPAGTLRTIAKAALKNDSK